MCYSWKLEINKSKSETKWLNDHWISFYEWNLSVSQAVSANVILSFMRCNFFLHNFVFQNLHNKLPYVILFKFNDLVCHWSLMQITHNMIVHVWEVLLVTRAKWNIIFHRHTIYPLCSSIQRELKGICVYSSETWAVRLCFYWNIKIVHFKFNSNHTTY